MDAFGARSPEDFRRLSLQMGGSVLIRFYGFLPTLIVIALGVLPVNCGVRSPSHSVPFTELFQGQVVWDGVIEVFKLKGHPKTDRV
jgi:hypothetical protein